MDWFSQRLDRLFGQGREQLRLVDLRPYVYERSGPPSDISRKEAKAHFEEFMRRLPEDLAYFRGVLESQGIDLARSDEEVLDDACEWIVARGRRVREPSTLPEPFRFEEFEWDLDLYTKSACCYLGLMMADALQRNAPGAEWVLVTENKRDVDYHKPVVRAADGWMQFEPLGIAMNQLRSRLNPEHQFHLRPMHDLYHIWLDNLTKPLGGTLDVR